MAIVDLTVTATRQTQAFKTAPGGIVEDTFLPVGLTWFFAAGTVLAKGAGDETHIRCTTTFPTQYAYILKEIQISIRLSLGVTHNFSDAGLIICQNCVPVPSVPNQNLGLESNAIAFEFGTATAADPFRNYDLIVPYHQLIQAPDNQTAAMIIELADEAAGATNAGIFSLTSCFWRYGLEQALSIQLNAPQPVVAF